MVFVLDCLSKEYNLLENIQRNIYESDSDEVRILYSDSKIFFQHVYLLYFHCDK